MVQIELLGCTGVGKTTLSSQIYLACQQAGIDLLPHEEYLLTRLRLNWVRSRIVRTILIDLYCLTACLGTFRKHSKLYRFIYAAIARLQVAWLVKINLFRNITKGIGTYEIIKQRPDTNQVVLVDGGTLQAIQPLFVHLNHHFDQVKIFEFTRLVPLPDMAIYLEQPACILTQRIKARGHNRIPELIDQEIVSFIEKAFNAYRVLFHILVMEGWMSNIMPEFNIFASNPSNFEQQSFTKTLEIISLKVEEASMLG